MEHNLGTPTSCFLRHAIAAASEIHKLTSYYYTLVAREKERSPVQHEGKMGAVVVTNEDITGS